MLDTTYEAKSQEIGLNPDAQQLRRCLCVWADWLPADMSKWDWRQIKFGMYCAMEKFRRENGIKE